MNDLMEALLRERDPEPDSGPDIYPGDVVEHDHHDYAGRPARVERFTVTAVHHLESDVQFEDGWWVSALSPQDAAEGWPSGEAALLRDGLCRSTWGLMPHAGYWIPAEEVRLVSRGAVQLDIFDVLKEG